MKRASAVATALVAFAVFGYLAIAPEYYRLRWLSGDASDQTLLRKLYSLAAFSIAGFVAARATRATGRTPTIAATAAVVALFSAGIEIAQRLAGSRETLGWNLADVLFGAAGGALGAYLEARRRYL
jgi:hypothetical protein